jgi:hypothetical protein
LAGGCGSAYFWFYEWNLSDAVNLGEHTPGSWSWDWTIDAQGQVAQLNGEVFKLTVEATVNGAELALECGK